jgi:uncharacterized YccA/Bax inhibitor family protein
MGEAVTEPVWPQPDPAPEAVTVDAGTTRLVIFFLGLICVTSLVGSFVLAVKGLDANPTIAVTLTTAGVLGGLLAKTHSG